MRYHCGYATHDARCSITSALFLSASTAGYGLKVKWHDRQERRHGLEQAWVIKHFRH
jgi:hypothetical protein